MYNLLKLFFVLSMVTSLTQYAGPAITRDFFYEDILERISALTGFAHKELSGRTLIKNLEIVHPEVRRDLVEYTREVFNASMDNTALDRYDTVEQAVDFLYQFVDQPDVQAYHNRDYKTANSF